MTMTRIAINPYGPSESVNLLQTELANGGITTVKMKRENSRFRARATDLIVNWGSSRPMTVAIGAATLLNNPSNVNIASNKIQCLTQLTEAGVPTVEWTQDKDEAIGWLNEGAHVFCRNELRGHSGAGIVCVSNTVPEDLGNVEHSTLMPTSPLYTKGVSNRHREYRVHVMNGEVLFIQQKRRATGYRENPDYSNVVRNHGNGWIYSNLNMTAPNTACLDAAIAAVTAVGLDFGAVDVITNGDLAYVLEINTAPGLSGDTTRLRYAAAFTNICNGVDVLTGIESQFPTLGQATLQELTAAIALETPPLEAIQEYLAAIEIPLVEEIQESIAVSLEPTPGRRSRRIPAPELSPAPVAPVQVEPTGEFFVILINTSNARDVAWLDATTGLYFVARGIGSYTSDQITVISTVIV